MRKHTLLMICLFASLMLSSCANSQPTDVKLPVTYPNTLEQSSDQETDLSPVEQMPMAAISMPVKTAIETAQDGTEIFRYSYQEDISLILPDAEVAHKIKLDLLNRIDGTTDEASDLNQSAALQYSGSSWNPYLYQVIFEPSRIDYNVLSLTERTTVYRGGSHPETHYESVTYDATTGNILRLNDVLAADVSEDAISQLIIESLTEQSKTISLYENFESSVLDRFNENFRQDTRWYFSASGLWFYFPPYEIAPYSSGLIVAEIPYEKLTGILNDAYFPPERQTAAGTLSAEHFSEDKIQKFDQFAEVILDPAGDMLLLHTDHYVQDIRIKTGLSDGAELTVFAAYGLTDKDAIMLQCSLNEQSNLKITYTVTAATDISVNLQ